MFSSKTNNVTEEYSDVVRLQIWKKTLATGKQ